LSSGNYQWSVKANFYGAWGSYAPYLSFTVGTSPIPSSPSGSISDNTPTFKWSKVGSATQYSYTLLKGTTTVYTKTVTSSACTTSGCSNTPTTVLSDGSYTWKVRAYVSGTWKNYSSSLAFKLATIPILSAPSGTVKTATPTFTWTLISNATSYSYTVYKGTATLYSRTVASSACGSSTTYCADTPSTILNSGAYTWKVRAYAGGVWNAYSAVKSFTVSTTAFNSQFTSENTGWSAVSGTWSRSSGYYQAAGVANSIISSKHNNTYGTMTYEVKMKRTGCATCGNVLFFNGATSGKNWSKAYAFIYVNDGEFSIVSISGTTVTKLIDWTAYSGISTSWNILKVTYNKSTGYTEFFINGVSVATGTLTVFTSGQVGAGLYSDSGSSNKLSIDYATLNLIAPSAVVTENNNGIVIHEQTAPVQNGSTSYLKMP
jgi:hypothetical protein